MLARLVPLAPTDRDLRAQATREVATAAARYDAAQARATRAAQLAQDRAGSVRASEEAVADREAARAALDAARARRARLTSAPLESDVALDLRAPLDGALRQVTAVEGQPVTAGAALFEVVADDALWVRVPVYAGAVASVDQRASARVLPLGASDGDARDAAPIDGPPTADPLLATVDRYYRVENPGGAWSPGQRVTAWLAERAGAATLVVPTGAVVYDLHGGAWIYVTSAPRRYARRRVEVERVAGDLAVLTRGVTAGERVVTVGAAELYGTEFGAGH
ncbi:MAG: efflux RND transporter periplasmic adaptor subunit [Polyangiales bacterium]